MFRVFANILRLRLFNVGARLPRGKDISFQSYYGSSVQDGLDQLTQGRLQKNNLFGVGYKNGNLASIGCSCKGKVWSRERADLQHFQEWCKEIGKTILTKVLTPILFCRIHFGLSKCHLSGKIAIQLAWIGIQKYMNIILY